MPSIPSTPSTTSPTSQHTNVTTPEETPQFQPGMNPAIDHSDLSDIWDLSPPIRPGTTHTPAHGDSASHSRTQISRAPDEGNMEIVQQPYRPSQAHTRFQQSDASDIHSDLPSLRRTHINAGYRDGLTAGKTRVIQKGFDEGFPIGVEIALRVGRILGDLEGVVSTLRSRGGKVGNGGRRGAGRSGHDLGRKGEGSGMRASNANSKPMLEGDDGRRRDGGGDGDEGNPNRPETDRVGVNQEIDDQMASTQSNQARRSEMELLLTRAREELSITALMDGLQEEALMRADSLADLIGIEEAIVRWESIVLGCSGRTVQKMLVDKKGQREETKLSL